MKAWKLFRVRKNGDISPLFINRTLRIQRGVWFPAETHPTKGFAFRPFWHSSAEPHAPHLSEKGREWIPVEISGVTEMERPSSQGGKWFLSEWIMVE